MSAKCQLLKKTKSICLIRFSRLGKQQRKELSVYELGGNLKKKLCEIYFLLTVKVTPMAQEL